MWYHTAFLVPVSHAIPFFCAIALPILFSWKQKSCTVITKACSGLDGKILCEHRPAGEWRVGAIVLRYDTSNRFKCECVFICVVCFSYTQKYYCFRATYFILLVYDIRCVCVCIKMERYNKKTCTFLDALCPSAAHSIYLFFLSIKLECIFSCVISITECYICLELVLHFLLIMAWCVAVVCLQCTSIQL